MSQNPVSRVSHSTLLCILRLAFLSSNLFQNVIFNVCIPKHATRPPFIEATLYHCLLMCVFHFWWHRQRLSEDFPTKALFPFSVTLSKTQSLDQRACNSLRPGKVSEQGRCEDHRGLLPFPVCPGSNPVPSPPHLSLPPAPCH